MQDYIVYIILSIFSRYICVSSINPTNRNHQYRYLINLLQFHVGLHLWGKQLSTFPFRCQVKLLFYPDKDHYLLLVLRKRVGFINPTCLCSAEAISFSNGYWFLCKCEFVEYISMLKMSVDTYFSIPKKKSQFGCQLPKCYIVNTQYINYQKLFAIKLWCSLTNASRVIKAFHLPYLQ